MTLITLACCCCRNCCWLLHCVPSLFQLVGQITIATVQQIKTDFLHAPQPPVAATGWLRRRRQLRVHCAPVSACHNFLQPQEPFKRQQDENGQWIPAAAQRRSRRLGVGA